jgi:hypothetical protein
VALPAAPPAAAAERVLVLAGVRSAAFWALSVDSTRCMELPDVPRLSYVDA